MQLASLVTAAFVTEAQQVDQTDYAPGLIAFLVIFALAIASWLLFRSMTKHVRRATRNDPASPAPAEPAAGPRAPDGDSGTAN